MNKIKIEKAKLLAKLKENLESHVKEYNETKAVYLKDLIHNLEKKIADAKEGKAPDHHIELIVPQSYESSYKTAIAALEYSVDELVELNMQEFQSYVMDEWHWKQTFSMSNSHYKGR